MRDPGDMMGLGLWLVGGTFVLLYLLYKKSNSTAVYSQPRSVVAGVRG